MRKIKFRGKSAYTDEWVYGDLIQVCNSFLIYHGPQTEDEIVEREFEYLQLPGNQVTLVRESTVGQFTSLYDNNGKEIYEGDILDFNGLKIEVRFVRGVFALLCNGNLDDELCGDCRTDLFAKVIGNIHDNPELLNQ